MLPHTVAARRVASGVLGCPNCRERYGIVGGVADLRVGAETMGGGRTTGTASGIGEEGHSTGESAIRLAALLDLAEATGPVLLAGPTPAEAAALSALVGSVEVVHRMDDRSAGAEGAPGLTTILAGAGLPFRDGSMTGVALTGAAVDLLEEGLRVLRPGARLFLEPGSGLEARAAAGRDRVLVDDGDVLVVLRVP